MARRGCYEYGRIWANRCVKVRAFIKHVKCDSDRMMYLEVISI